MVQKERLVSECVKVVPGFAIEPVMEIMDSPNFGWRFASYLAPLLEWNYFPYARTRRWRWIYAAMRFLWKPADQRGGLLGRGDIGFVAGATLLYRIDHFREIINAMLMMENPDLRKISIMVGWRLKYIEVYRTLFFDVTDLRDDGEFMTGLWGEKGLRLGYPAWKEVPDEDERFLLKFGYHSNVGDFCGRKGWTIPLHTKARDEKMPYTKARKERADTFRTAFLRRGMGDPLDLSGKVLITMP